MKIDREREVRNNKYGSSLQKFVFTFDKVFDFISQSEVKLDICYACGKNLDILRSVGSVYSSADVMSNDANSQEDYPS